MNLLFAVENMYILIRDFIMSFSSLFPFKGALTVFFFNTLGFGARAVVLDTSPVLTGTFFLGGGGEERFIWLTISDNSTLF